MIKHWDQEVLIYFAKWLLRLNSLHLRDTYGQSHSLILIWKRKTSPSEYVSKILLVETLRE